MMDVPSSSPARDAESDFNLRLASLIDGGNVRVADVLDLLRSAVAEATSTAARRFRLFLRHGLYLLESGDTLYDDCTLALHDGARPMLIVRRVAREGEEGVTRTTLKLAAWPMASLAPSLAAGAFAVHAGQAGAIIHRGPVVVDARAQGGATTLPVEPVRRDEIEAFYANRRALQAVMKRAGAAVPWQVAQDAAAKRDLAQVIATCRDAFVPGPGDDPLIRSGQALPGVCRDSHPCMGATFHVLPRLVHPEVGATVLASLAAAVPALAAAGFEAILLGVVDPQSTELFHAEGDDGRIRLYANNHGYWSSGQAGIDPALGDEIDYIALARAASAGGMALIQDSVFGTLGYPPELERLALPGSGCGPLGLFLGGREAAFSEDGLFLRGLESCEAVPATDGARLEAYAGALARMHLGELFRLPRPNLFRPDVLDRVLQRVRWQIRTAGIAAFRVDMAKHIGVEPLRAIIETLRDEARAQGLAQPSIIMEYCSFDYRDLRFALSCAAPGIDRLYLYDFPLAHALQQVMLGGADWSARLPDVVNQRRVWQVPACCLVPIFIDHDPTFLPVYNGSAVTRDIVVAGLALALAMSANGPSVYCGYDDRHAAPADLARYFEGTEQEARRPLALPLSRDPDGPGVVFSELLAAVKRQGVLSDWDGEPLVFEGDADRLRITRTLRDGGRSRRAIFCLSRHGDATSMRRPGERIAFASGCGPSVALCVDDGE
jgi:hypothetical protein